jgi:hypothetical protein
VSAIQCSPKAAGATSCWPFHTGRSAKSNGSFASPQALIRSPRWPERRSGLESRCRGSALSSGSPPFRRSWLARWADPPVWPMQDPVHEHACAPGHIFHFGRTRITARQPPRSSDKKTPSEACAGWRSPQSPCGPQQSLRPRRPARLALPLRRLRQSPPPWSCSRPR